jgi:hypothetical protein
MVQAVIVLAFSDYVSTKALLTLSCGEQEFAAPPPRKPPAHPVPSPEPASLKVQGVRYRHTNASIDA